MIGIFGGTFDPVHNGHLRIALDAIAALDLARVHLIPLAHAVHREQPTLAAAQRLQLLQLAVAGHPELFADDREIRRTGPSYMVDTLESLRQELPDTPLCLMVGSDAFNGFSRWRQPERILELANLVVLQRPDIAPPSDPEALALLAGRQSSSLDLAASAAGRIAFLEVTQLAISSSDIRARIKAGQSPAFLMPPAVCQKVVEQGWYA